MYTVYKFRYYLIGVSFEVITDHKGLTFLSSTIYHNSRLIRWSLLLQQFSFVVTYCKGSDNVVADFFSRHLGGKFTQETERRITKASLQKFCLPLNRENETSSLVILHLNSQNVSLKNIIKNLKIEQNQDIKLQKIISQLKENEIIIGYQVYQDVLFHSNKNKNHWCVVIPQSMTKELVIATHGKLGHPGVYKTLCHLKTYYYWKGMPRDVKKYVLSCDTCQRVKHLLIAMEGEVQLAESMRPSDLVTVDFYGLLPRGRGGVQYILVVLDAFSKLVRLFSMKNATTQVSLKRILENYIPECGKPKRILIVSDNGTQFTSPRWRNTLEKEGITVVFSSIRHPQSNPTERVMREIGRMFRTFCSENHTSWANHVKNIENLLNITTHFSTEYAPHELHFGIPVKNEIEKLINFPQKRNINHDYIITLARENILKSFERRKKNLKVSTVQLDVGDRVLLRVRHLSNAMDKVTKKFFHLYEGPYIIHKVVGKNAFVLTDANNGNEIGTYNRTNLRKYYSD